MVLIMNETIKERKDRLNEMHKVWIEVTGSALTEVHKTDGFKGDRDDYKAKQHQHRNAPCQLKRGSTNSCLDVRSIKTVY